jgi:putative endonuclease
MQKKMAMTDEAQPIKKAARNRTASAARVAAFHTGISAESRACVYLIAKGYRILVRRFKTPQGEIDIVARRRGLLVFVEVKARATLDNAAYSVTPPHRQRRADLACGT